MLPAAGRTSHTVRTIVGAASLMTIIVLSGCTAEPTTPTAPTPAPSPVTPTATARTPVPFATDVPRDDATVAPVPEAAAGSQTAALRAAETVVTAFGQPGLPYPEWIGGLYPLLTQAGAAAYEDTDPSSVPVHQVTGPGRILPGSTEVALIVEVPTDAGLYTVSLSRPDPASPWLAERIRPAGS